MGIGRLFDPNWRPQSVMSNVEGLYESTSFMLDYARREEKLYRLWLRLLIAELNPDLLLHDCCYQESPALCEHLKAYAPYVEAVMYAGTYELIELRWLFIPWLGDPE